jgi:hypothetical protein
MYGNGGHVTATMNIWKSNLTLEETLLDKGIIKILIRKPWHFIKLSTKLKP